MTEIETYNKAINDCLNVIEDHHFPLEGSDNFLNLHQKIVRLIK